MTFCQWVGVYVADEAFDSQIMYYNISPFFGKIVKYRGMTESVISLSAIIIYDLCNWHTISRPRAQRTRDFIRQIRLLANDVEAITNLEKIIDYDFGFLLFREIEKPKLD